MAPRSSWKGFIRLSLVSVPVKAYTANASGAEIRLNQLHADCNQRVKYQKHCPEHGELQASDIVSGYEYSKGQYVIIQSEEIQKLRPKGDQSVNVKGFVSPDKLDPLYHAGKTFYLVPDGPVGQKPYALLHRGMVEKNTIAIAQVILSGKEQLVILRPIEKLIAMTVLNHESKIKSADSFEDEIVAPDLTKEEQDLTNLLIGASQIEDFDYSKYKDDYIEKMTKVIQAKVDGEELVQVPDLEEPKILNLMDALKRSVAEARGIAAEDLEPAANKAHKKTTAKKAATKKTAKKMAPSATGKKKTTRKKSG